MGGLRTVLARLRRRRDPNAERPIARMLRVLITKADKLSVLLTLAGLLGLLLLPLTERRAKFDEKSLLVGAAVPTFRSDQSLGQALNLAAVVHAHQHAAAPNTTLAQVLAQHMQALGLEAQITHMCAPDAESDMGAADGTCQHVHGVLRGPLADGTESLLVVTPAALTSGTIENKSPYWDAPSEGSVLTLSSAAALMHHLHTVTWLSRDVVWVVPDARCGATAALKHWADVHLGGVHFAKGVPATHGDTQSHGRVGRSVGVPQQAVVLQADRVAVNNARVQLVGFDGQLPKLDTYLVLKDVTYYTLPDMTVQKPPGIRILDTWARRVQATGLPTGPHAALKDYRVDAATLRLTAKGTSGRRLKPRPDPTPGTTPPPLPHMLEARTTHLAQYLELVLRSFNNLNERFHHSFFLYLLTDTQHFVTVENYIVTLVLLILVLILKAAKQRHVLLPSPTQPTQPASTASQRSEEQGSVTAASSAADKLPTPSAPRAETLTTDPATGQAQIQAHAQGQLDSGVGASEACTKQHIELLQARERLSAQAQLLGLWPRAIALGLMTVAACVALGSILRAMLCPQCQLCQYPTDRACCDGNAARGGGCAAGGAQWGTCRAAPAGAADAVLAQAARFLPVPTQQHVAQLSAAERYTLLVTAVIAVVTLGWELVAIVQGTSQLLVTNSISNAETTVKTTLAASQQQDSICIRQKRGGKKDDTDRVCCGLSGGVMVGAVRVVVLVCSAVLLTGVASVNWAIAYLLAACLAVLTSVTPTHPPTQHTNKPRAPKMRLARALHVITVCALSPVIVVLALQYMPMQSMHGSHDRMPRKPLHSELGWVSSLRKIACCTWHSTYHLVWAVYLPCWLVELVRVFVG